MLIRNTYTSSGGRFKPSRYDAGALNLLLVLKQHQIRCDLERQMARIALEQGEDLPPHRNGRPPGDARALRGVPVLVRGGFGGAIAGTRPDRVD